MVRKGICKNIGLCNNANTHKVIIITDDDAPFECECGEPLEEYKEDEPISKNNGNKKKLIGIIAAAVLVIAVVVSAIVLGGGSSADEEGEGVAVVNDTVAQVEQEAAAPNTVVVEKTDTLVVEKTDTVVVEKTVEVEKPQPKPAAPKPQPQASSSNGKLSLSYGSYTGDIKGGYPDGMGRLTYKTSRVINKYDSKQRTADAGDYVIGEFVRGYFVQGKHYSASGELVETIMVGVPASNSYESK